MDMNTATTDRFGKKLVKETRLTNPLSLEGGSVRTILNGDKALTVGYQGADSDDPRIDRHAAAGWESHHAAMVARITKSLGM